MDLLLKQQKLINFDNLRMGFLSHTKGASVELFHNLKCNVEPYE
jgi:hypothetical protein